MKPRCRTAWRPMLRRRCTRRPGKHCKWGSPTVCTGPFSRTSPHGIRKLPRSHLSWQTPRQSWPSTIRASALVSSSGHTRSLQSTKQCYPMRTMVLTKQQRKQVARKASKRNRSNNNNRPRRTSRPKAELGRLLKMKRPSNDYACSQCTSSSNASDSLLTHKWLRRIL